MPILFRRIFAYKFLPVCWTLLIITLLCLPGSMVPGTGIFGLPNFDKAVHIILFGAHVILWGWHYEQAGLSSQKFRQVVIIDVVLTVVLGIALEYVQKYWIPNRSFDGKDILADLTGALAAGTWLLIRNGRKPI